jgi:hypothetical protein
MSEDRKRPLEDDDYDDEGEENGEDDKGDEKREDDTTNDDPREKSMRRGFLCHVAPHVCLLFLLFFVLFFQNLILFELNAHLLCKSFFNIAVKSSSNYTNYTCACQINCEFEDGLQVFLCLFLIHNNNNEQLLHLSILVIGKKAKVLGWDKFHTLEPHPNIRSEWWRESHSFTTPPPTPPLD